MEQIEDEDNKRPYKVSRASFPSDNSCMFNSSFRPEKIFSPFAIINSYVRQRQAE